MKMEYVKPSMIVERFTLSQSIATACNAADDPSRPYGDPNQQSRHICVWNYQGDVIFSQANTNCVLQIGDGEEFGIICYNNPSADLRVLGS